MIRVESQAGVLRVRSRSATAAQLAMTGLVPALVLAVAGYAAARVGLVTELTCDRAAGSCVRVTDGRTRWSVPIAAAARAEVHARAGARGRSRHVLVLSGPAGDWTVADDLERGAALADAARLNRFLAGEEPGPLRLRYDRRLGALFPLGLALALAVFPLARAGRATVCTVDRMSRTVRVRTWLGRTRRLGEFSAVAVRSIENLRRARGTAGARRIVLLDSAGRAFPVTAWLRLPDDPEPAAERLRAATGLA